MARKKQSRKRCDSVSDVDSNDSCGSHSSSSSSRSHNSHDSINYSRLKEQLKSLKKQNSALVISAKESESCQLNLHNKLSSAISDSHEWEDKFIRKKKDYNTVYNDKEDFRESSIRYKERSVSLQFDVYYKK